MFLISFLAAGCLMAPAQSDVAAATTLLERTRAVVRDGRFDALGDLFTQARYAESVRAIAGDGRALRTLKVDAFPAPKGLERFGYYWIIFHRYQGLEAQHDRIHPMVRTGDGLALGPEIPEDIAIPFEITHHDFKVSLEPSSASASFVTTSDLKPTSGSGSVLMRMNDAYRITSAKYAGELISIFVDQPLKGIVTDPTQTELVRAGGALVLTNPGKGGKLELTYSASINIPGGDKTTAGLMLLTSYWYPHIGRGPATSSASVSGPTDWLILTNGNTSIGGGTGSIQNVSFENKVAIPYFHLVAGPYKMRAETTDRGRTFRAWHLDDTSDSRAKQDVESAKNAVAFFEDRYGQFPYNHYDIVDTPDYYGIECYSFTLLSPSITSWATSHEVGHTWFGGMVPNSYIKSIWNESLTQYIDSSVFKKNSDRSLNNGYASRTAPVALADSFLAHGPYGNVGYYRGAYVMKMLENEIGDSAMTLALNDLVRQRMGKRTEWSDIAAAFKQSTKQNTDWFFEQWVYGKQFSTLSITRAFAETGPRGGFVTTIDIAQGGTPKPFRIKVRVVLTSRTGEKVHLVDLTKASQTFYLDSDARPTRVTLDPFGYTLAAVPAPVLIKGG
ncbi:MAG: hypothetical protein M3R13_00480 [Armatimonadota bacterium]|nr:hypothetical protein [Armatimonadota bacterium]